jgi:hypothetical protein
VGAEHADRLSGLHEERLIVLQALEGRDDRVESLPRARGAAGAAVHDELVGALGHIRVEVVLEHAERGFLRPRDARELRPPRRSDDPARDGAHRSMLTRLTP